MATPTTLPASFTAGAVLTATQMNDLRGAFRILQVVQGTDSTAFSTTSATFSDDGLSATITPSSTSSKILVIAGTFGGANAATTEGEWRIVRGASTELCKIAGYGYSAGGATPASYTMVYLDSPSTTSATTYKTQIRRTGGAGSLFTASNNSFSSITLLEISA